MRELAWTHYLPIATTLLSIPFAAVVYRRYRHRGGGTHLLWWSAGIVVYGMGTFAESWITLAGWNPFIFKFWYVVGALLGGAPLAQGTVWLLLRERTARRLSWALVAAVGVAAACVIASPIDYGAVDPHLPSGSAFAWQWVRGFSPFINTYAVVFLIGGALWSAWRFWRPARGGAALARDRFVGNVLIAAGAILPGIGGGYARMGQTEVLYVMELAGIVLIWAGYVLNVRKRPVSGRLLAMAATVATLAIGWPGVVAAQPGVGAAQATGELTVTLVDPGGAPMARVPVSLRAGEVVAIVTTDAAGRARFEHVEPGDYTIAVAVPGFEPISEAWTVRGGQRGEARLSLAFAAIRQQVTVVATRTPNDLLDAPAEVIVIDRDDLDRVQARSLDDVFRYEPAVEMAEAPRRLGQTPNIRGFDDQRVLTLRDGARVAGFNSGHRGTLFFDVEDIEGVEVVKGSASALYGSGAIGGVISITTRAPGDLLRRGQRHGASVTAGFSSAYSEWTVAPRVYGQSPGGLGWILSYTGRRNDGTVRLGGPPGSLEQAEEDIDAVGARLVAPIGSNGLLRASLDGYDHSGRTTTNLALLSPGPGEIVDRDTRNLTANVRFAYQGSRPWNQDLSVTGYWDESRIDERRPFDDRQDEIRYRTWGLDLRNVADAGAGRHRLAWGVEVVHERQEAVRNAAAHAFFPDGRRLLTGGYVQDELELLGGRLSIVPGLRYDRWDSRPDDPDLRSQSVGRLSPRIAASARLTDRLAAVASYGQGFRVPYFQELFLRDVHFAFPLPGNRFFLALFQPNPGLRPETSENVEIGLRYRSGRLAIRGAAWRTGVEDFIELLPVATSPFPPPGGLQTQLWQAINRRDALLRGVEGTAEWAPSRRWTLRAAYSLTRGEDRATGEPLLQVPPDKLVLGLGWRSRGGGTTLDWATRVHAARDRVPTGVEPVAGTTLHDAHLSWAPRGGDAMVLRLSISNLADRHYDNPRFGTPGIGRDVRVGATIRY